MQLCYYITVLLRHNCLSFRVFSLSVITKAEYAIPFDEFHLLKMISIIHVGVQFKFSVQLLPYCVMYRTLS